MGGILILIWLSLCLAGVVAWWTFPLAIIVCALIGRALR